MKESEFKFFYPVVILAQTAFREDGSTFVHGVESIREGHILYQGRLLCGGSMEVIRNNLKAKSKKIVKNRVENVGICKVCQEKYKRNSDSLWSKWVSGIPEKHEEVYKMNKA